MLKELKEGMYILYKPHLARLASKGRKPILLVLQVDPIDDSRIWERLLHENYYTALRKNTSEYWVYVLLLYDYSFERIQRWPVSAILRNGELIE